ncbi:MAG: hypothetical protein J1E98_05035 [Lachnospiraceae bacterium]|nr:hypothetical protein [Lachnospiraceae bacterium]
MEIGSIFEIDPDIVRGCGDDRQDLMLEDLSEVKKYNKKYCAYTASCREAIALALRSLEQCRPHLVKSCLLPAYMCDTVFFPFEHEGWEINFYHVNKKLEVDEKELLDQIDKIKPGLLFVHPYYGVDTWRTMRTLLVELKEQGICIMEDVTQSYYLEGVGAEADYVVGSLRKWYPVPDGGFVVSDEKLAVEHIEPNGEYAMNRLKILTDKWEYLNGKNEQDEDKRKLDKEKFLSQNREMEEQLDKYFGIREMSNETAYILKRTDEHNARLRRSDNYKYLYDRLKDRMLISEDRKDDTKFAPIISIPETAPLYFPVYADKRDELQSFLSSSGIYAPVLWPIGKENAEYLTDDEKYIYEHMLALPIDQRYGREEMQRIVEVLKDYENQSCIVDLQEEYEHKADMSVENARVDVNVRSIADGCDFKDRESDVIGIRADANEEVAMGHIMRCITIAGWLKKLGKRVCFFTADEYAAELLEQAGMDHVCLHSEWAHMEDEVSVLKEMLKERGCKKLLVDSYYVGPEYFEKLSDVCKLIYIDDCFEDIYPVDMLINYNAYHVRFNYEEAYRKTYPDKTKLLLGTAYVPLREEFQGQEDTGYYLEVDSALNNPTSDSGNCSQMKINKYVQNSESMEIKNVLLSSGGGDAYNVLSGILNEAVKDKEFDSVVFHTVVGRFNPNVEELKQLAEHYENIKLHYDVKNMAKLMESCNAAVSAAGTMLFELSAMQVPSVFFVSADNQQYDSEFFAKEERMLFAGDIRSDRNECIKSICNGLKKILDDEGLRNRMKMALHEVTDGRGAERIAKAIVSL